MNSDGEFRKSLYPAVAGFAGLSLGIGLLRFAYSPMVPSLIEAHWTTVSQAAWLGSANFWGYTLGVVIALPLSRHLERHFLLLGAMLIGLTSLVACAWNGGMEWLVAWRFLQGVTGAIIMAILPGSVMATVPEQHRRVVGGITIAGVGFAFVPSLLIPLVNPYGPSGEWIMSAVLGVFCTLVAAPFIIKHLRGRAPRSASTPRMPRHYRWSFLLLLATYTLAGVCLIPDALFLSNYLDQNLHTSPIIAGTLFSWFALGLGVGAVMGGIIAHRYGSLISILVLTGIGIASNSVILFGSVASVVSLAAFFFAIWAGGTVSIGSIRTLELAGPDAHARFWPMMCFVYSVGMWIASSGFAEMLSRGFGYVVFFWFVEGCAVVFLVLILASYWSAARSRPETCQSQPG